MKRLAQLERSSMAILPGLSHGRSLVSASKHIDRVEKSNWSRVTGDHHHSGRERYEVNGRGQAEIVPLRFCRSPGCHQLHKLQPER